QGLVHVHFVNGPPVARVAADLNDSDVTRGLRHEGDVRDRALSRPVCHGRAPGLAVAGNVNLVAARMIVFETVVSRVEHDTVERLRRAQVDLEDLAIGLRRAGCPPGGAVPVNSRAGVSAGGRRYDPAGTIEGSSPANPGGVLNSTREMLEK